MRVCWICELEGGCCVTVKVSWGFSSGAMCMRFLGWWESSGIPHVRDGLSSQVTCCWVVRSGKRSSERSGAQFSSLDSSTRRLGIMRGGDGEEVFMCSRVE